MSERRPVRVTQSFFDRLDELLPDERTSGGRPSSTDFLLHELPAIIDALAEGYERVTLAVEAVPGVRVLVTAGRLVARVAIYVTLAPDDGLELVFVDIDDA